MGFNLHFYSPPPAAMGVYIIGDRRNKVSRNSLTVSRIAATAPPPPLAIRGLCASPCTAVNASADSSRPRTRDDNYN